MEQNSERKVTKDEMQQWLKEACEAMGKQVSIDEEVLEGNKLIAEFMGLVPNPNGDGRTYGINAFYDEDRWLADNWVSLKYHTSWDWLMAVVEKINSTVVKDYGHMGVIIYTSTCHINDDYQIIIETTATKEGGIRMCVWEAVVEFVKWYKKQTQKDATA